MTPVDYRKQQGCQYAKSLLHQQVRRLDNALQLLSTRVSCAKWKDSVTSHIITPQGGRVVRRIQKYKRQEKNKDHAPAA